jgi:hypothetical protein
MITFLEILTLTLASAFVLLFAWWSLRQLRWRGFIRSSAWAIYRDKARAAEHDPAERDWCVRNYQRMWDAKSDRRWTDFIPDHRLPSWLHAVLLVILIAAVAAGWLVFHIKSSQALP